MCSSRPQLRSKFSPSLALTHPPSSPFPSPPPEWPEPCDQPTTLWPTHHLVGNPPNTGTGVAIAFLKMVAFATVYLPMATPYHYLTHNGNILLASTMCDGNGNTNSRKVLDTDVCPLLWKSLGFSLPASEVRPSFTSHWDTHFLPQRRGLPLPVTIPALSSLSQPCLHGPSPPLTVPAFPSLPPVFLSLSQHCPTAPALPTLPQPSPHYPQPTPHCPSPPFTAPALPSLPQPNSHCPSPPFTAPALTSMPQPSLH